jgi:predicted ArsR family transcriptional regulator
VSPPAPTTRQGSRDRVLALLRTSTAPLGVPAITGAVGLSANAVRFHLQNLIENGSVAQAAPADQPGPGRPAIRYTATPTEDNSPDSAYRLLSGLLARELSRSGSPDAASDAGRDWARALAPPRWTDMSHADPIEVVGALFENSGFDPRRGPDGQTLELHRCPFLDLAVEQPDVVCGIHLGLVKGLLEEIGARREVRLIPVLDGSGPCLVRLTEARTRRRRRGAAKISTEEPAP